MAHSYVVLQIRFRFIPFTAFLLLTACFLTTTTTSLRLIRCDSIFPPVNNPNLIVPDFTDDAMDTLDDISDPLIPDVVLLVNISTGEPQLFAMDTGSPLTWVQRPIGCTSPIYDPKASSTFKMLRCYFKSRHFIYIDASNCGCGCQCTYSVRYLDASISEGIAALEKFTLAMSKGGEWELSDLLFESIGLQVHNYKHSLVSRIGNKFSYCIGNISDPGYVYNRLTLGEGAVLEGRSTPVRIWQGHYVVSLKGISIGKKQLDINEQDFDFKVVVDSGTTLTYLQRSEYEQVRREVMSLLDGRLQRVTVNNDEERLCYRGDLWRDLKGFPIVTLRFAEGAEIYLDLEGVFRRVADGVFCLGVGVARSDVNLIGVYAQQWYNIGFDLDAMRVSFMSIECELLDDD